MAEPADPMDRTTQGHVLRAVGGDADSLDWLVERLTPLLLAQARLRIGPHLQRVIEPHDLVQEVWAIALPKLPELQSREGLGAGMMVAFLARCLTYRCNDLVRKHIVGKPRPEDSSVGMLARLPGRHSGAVTRAVRRETRDSVRDAIEQLDEQDRQVVLMRGIERHAVGQIAVVTGLSENLVSVRYRRALDKLRALLPADIVELFADG